MAGMKSIEKPGIDDALPHGDMAGQFDRAGGGVIQRGDLALQIGNTGLDLLCMGQQFLSGGCQSIAFRLTFCE